MCSNKQSLQIVLDLQNELYKKSRFEAAERQSKGMDDTTRSFLSHFYMIFFLWSFYIFCLHFYILVLCHFIKF